MFTLTGNFSLEEWLEAAKKGTFVSAYLEIVDMRRCNLNAIRTMDLSKLTRHLRSARDAGRLIPGKTAILVSGDRPLFYSPAHRLFHSFSVFAKENALPREFKLFTSLGASLRWLDNPALADKHIQVLRIDDGRKEAVGNPSIQTPPV